MLVQASRFHDPVLRLIRQELAAGRLAPGDKLPPERELALRLGLGRSAVRRCLARLEHQGRIIRHVGRGTFLTSGVAEAPSALRPDTSPAEIMAVRLLIEPQMLRLAVSSAAPTDFEAMQRCLTMGEAATTYEEFERWDSALHTAIAAATHNSFLLEIFSSMNEARTRPLWGSVKQRTFTPQRRREYEADHRNLVEALMERDSDAAQVVMRAHLRRIRSALLGADA